MTCQPGWPRGRHTSRRASGECRALAGGGGRCTGACSFWCLGRCVSGVGGTEGVAASRQEGSSCAMAPLYPDLSLPAAPQVLHAAMGRCPCCHPPALAAFCTFFTCMLHAPCRRFYTMPWGADPAAFPAPPGSASLDKPHPGSLLITGEIAATESHVEVGGCCRGGGGRWLTQALAHIHSVSLSHRMKHYL